nr:LuxR C-terminal-related transcriptional regulator [Variovorax terrae]
MKRNSHEPARPDAAHSPTLSARELQVLELLGAGKTTKEIAFELDLSNRTVDIHRANIKRKLGLKSGTELLAFALSRI